MAKIFRFEYEDLHKALESLFNKFLLFKYERLKRYNFLFSPPVFLRNSKKLIRENEIIKHHTHIELEKNELSTYQHISLIAGMISYIITYSPRSSETNEIHKIDMNKIDPDIIKKYMK